MQQLLDQIGKDQPVLIAGPTASGKSSLALKIATTLGGTVINADALQVFDCWQQLSARPDAEELAQAVHKLYGHVPYRETYSTGHWLRDITDELDGESRPIIVGGTGLNFTALTQGLADIPPIPSKVRAKAESLSREEMLEALDPVTAERIDTLNRARVQRAWEVMTATGRSISAWQAAQDGSARWRSNCWRRVSRLLSSPVGSNSGISGGGGGGAVSSRFSRTNFPRSTGELRVGWELTRRNDPWPSNPRRGAAPSGTLRNLSPLTFFTP